MNEELGALLEQHFRFKTQIEFNKQRKKSAEDEVTRYQNKILYLEDQLEDLAHQIERLNK